MNRKKQENPDCPETEEVVTGEAMEEELPQEEVVDVAAEELERYKAEVARQEEQFLRLAAEYDNFRRRSQKEKESAWSDAKADAILAFLPVYDNLERAVKQETEDEAYAKGVEMTMNGLREILLKLGVTELPALGETFDPNFHNAVMHVEDAHAGKGEIVEVFQSGFKLGEKVIRFAMVKVAN
ncbi:MAG: nucleotide exchange factor GrpE [Oscillospiraceae bacterium]|nr:nucleotide exchange factor GrpE [Oscillospiraceae bacterium]